MDWALSPLFVHHSWLKITYKTSLDAIQRIHFNSGAHATGIFEKSKA